MSFSRLLRFFSNPFSITSSTSSAPEKEESSSNSNEPKKEESSSNSKIMVSTSTSSIALLGVMLMASSTFIYYLYSRASSSNSSVPKKEESSSNSSEPKNEESSSNSNEKKKEESSSKSSAPKKEESSSNSSEPKNEESSSNSSIQKRFKYDVFLSFRGEDTRRNFVGHLYQALKRNGIETYKDDETIEQGERINDQLLKSIEDSKFYIIVFSKSYASSSWCLDELVKIMECQKMTEHTAFPVFYDVEPTEVRKQSGAVKEAFAEHDKKKDAGKWREALTEASKLAGWELKATANGDESKLIQMIVDDIFIKKNSTLSNADGKLVGMETRINDVLSYLDIGTEDVRMIGIWGMGGGGKTTLARAVYDQISNDFEGKSFVENVREFSQPSLSGLKKLQKRILKDVLNKEHINLSSVHDGKNMLKATMRSRKILVVLDDVDHIEQLKALAGEPDWFKSGSRIIITTRDEQVLLAHQVKFVHDVNMLSFKEAICLFSRHAFQKENPIRGYEELSRNVVQYANGLPLTIKVLGSSLCGKGKLIWVETIKRLKDIPLKDTLVKLELSYDGLEADYKEIFLDIACIFKGQTKEDAIRILESCGFYARNGLDVLKQRSLITISKHRGVLGMHDHIEEMGKNIVRREHPDEPNKHSRLWIREEIEDILVNDKGTEVTRCLKLDMLRGNYRIPMKGLGKMKKLQYLEVKFAYYDTSELNDSTQYFPNSLKYLKFENYPFSYLPKTFQANDLVGLGIRDSRMAQLWEEGEKKLMPVCCQKLKHLDISDSKIRTFDLGLTPNLERLYLFNCADFVDLHVSVACPNLKILNLGYTRLRSLDLKLIPNLELLDLEKCNKLVEINAPVGCLKEVVRLNLSGCLRFTYFVFGGRREPKDNCSSATLNLVGESLDLCPLHPESNLPKLRFRCDYEEDLPLSIGNIEKLISFGLCACTDLKKFSDMICSLQFLKKLELQGSIPEFPKDLGQLEYLEELYLSSSKIKHLPDSICMLKRLKSLEVNNGDLLEKLPEDLGQLECLKMLHVRSKKIEFLPESICLLQRLKYLILDHCALLEKLPEDLGLLECLEVLVITDTGISHLPQSIFGLKGLLIAASLELLQLYDFPLEIKTTTSSIRHEAKFINVEEISLESRSINFGFVEKLVGMETRVKDVVSSLEIGIDDVRMIGIKGMGGAGKTTLARAVFDLLSANFEAKSFVENVREVSNGSVFRLKKLQEQIFSDVLNEHLTVNALTDRENMMKRRMCDIKVLLVLDDVDDKHQLEALAGDCMWFKPGSRIIITTRDEQLLLAHRLFLIRDIDLLSDQEATSLFSRYAFGTENPLQGYEELSREVVSYAAGLPLTIEVLGSFLSGKDKDDWEDAIDRIKRIPLKETLEQTLELSYTSLEDELKEIFLDIACILKGQTKEDAIRILESCGFHARYGLRYLMLISLITVDDFGLLGMHDHIEEMGKNIVRRSHPDEPNKHSRLWIKEEIEDILANEKGTEETRCLKLKKSRLNAGIVMNGLGRMKKLEYLEVKFASYGPYQKTSDAECLDDTSQYFSNSIKYLKCTNYPFLYLPKTFQANNLVGLEMESSRRMVQLWEEGEEKFLLKLRFLSFFKSMLTTFDFEMTPNLETLFLRDSPNLVRMPTTCKKLEHLDISGSKLRTFDLGLTPNLVTLSLERCAQFVNLQVSAACPTLTILILRNSSLRSLDLELIPNLESLDLQYSKELVEINFGCLKKVVHLYLDDCVLLEKLPEDIGRFECLKELVITNTRISHLPQSIFRLEGLYITASPELLQLYDFPSEIKTSTHHTGVRAHSFLQMRQIMNSRR